MTKKRTPWLGRNHDPSSRPVRTKKPTPQQVAETVLQELRDPGYLVSFYEGDVITLDKALHILAKEVLKETHCRNCECIHEPCGYVIGSPGCTDFHERKNA